MFMNLLAGCSAPEIIMVVIMGCALVGVMFWSNRSQKKREEQINKTLDAIQPGNKVKTIGGICGVVVEVCAEDNTFILETGSEESGKSYIKFDKKAVYQTDAVAPDAAPVEEAKAEGEAEEAPFEEAKTEAAPKAEEAPSEETDAKEE